MAKDQRINVFYSPFWVIVLNFSEFIEKTIKRGRGYRYHTYETEFDGDVFKLYHHGTLILSASLSKKKVKRWLITSISDSQAISRCLCILGLPYLVCKWDVHPSDEFWRRRAERRRKLMARATKSYPLKILEKIGIRIHPVKPREYGFTLELEGNVLKVTMEGYKLVIQKYVWDLFGNIIFKLVLFSERENEYLDEDYYVEAVALLGRDETDQLWMHFLPPRYYLASIEACERWLFGMDKEDIMVMQT